MLYSENDALCRPLAVVYDRLSREHPGVLDWEDKYVSKFLAAGFRPAKPIYYHLRFDPDVRLEAYYRVPFPDDPQKRLIYIEDTWIGDAGGFRTDVWVFKSSIGIPAERDFIGSNDFRPDDIDYAVIFSGRYLTAAKRYRVIPIPYYFCKIASPKQKTAMESQYTVLSVPHLPSGASYAIQRPFTFGANTVILAEDKFEFLVYSLQNGRIDDVCYFITAGYLNAIRDHR